MEFSFFVSFSAKLWLWRIKAVETGGGIREILIFRLGNYFNEKISDHKDISATSRLGLPNLCTKSSESLANRYEIDT